MLGSGTPGNNFENFETEELLSNFKNSEKRYGTAIEKSLNDFLRKRQLLGLSTNSLHYTAFDNCLIVETDVKVSPSLIKKLDETASEMVYDNSSFEMSYKSESCVELPKKIKELSKNKNALASERNSNSKSRKDKELEGTPRKRFQKIRALSTSRKRSTNDTAAETESYWRAVVKFTKKESKPDKAPEPAPVTELPFFYQLTGKPQETIEEQMQEIFRNAYEESEQAKNLFLLRNSSMQSDGGWECFTLECFLSIDGKRLISSHGTLPATSLLNYDPQSKSFRLRRQIYFNRDTREFSFIAEEGEKLKPYKIDPKNIADTIKGFVSWVEETINGSFKLKGQHKISLTPTSAPSALETDVFRSRMRDQKYPARVESPKKSADAAPSTSTLPSHSGSGTAGNKFFSRSANRDNFEKSRANSVGPSTARAPQHLTISEYAFLPRHMKDAKSEYVNTNNVDAPKDVAVPDNSQYSLSPEKKSF